MSANALSIWQIPAYLLYVQPALTDSAIAAAQKDIGFELPREYLELLRTQNGGYIRYRLPDMVHNTIAGIGPNFPSLSPVDWDEEVQECVNFKLQGLVPFDGDGHWHLCFDYRKSPTKPCITYIDVECDQQSRVAGSFAEYLEKLEIDVNDELVLEGITDIEKLKSKLSAALKMTFEPPNSYDYGYPVHRAMAVPLKKNGIAEWLCIDPNVVPRGFIRDDDPQNAEAKKLTAEFAPRFPELPANSWILTATDGIRTKVTRACAESGVAVRPLQDYVKKKR
jgi:hypothetical protein